MPPLAVVYSAYIDRRSPPHRVERTFVSPSDRLERSVVSSACMCLPLTFHNGTPPVGSSAIMPAMNRSTKFKNRICRPRSAAFAFDNAFTRETASRSRVCQCAPADPGRHLFSGESEAFGSAGAGRLFARDGGTARISMPRIADPESLPRSSQVTDCCRAWSPMPPAMAGISSATGPVSLVTVARSIWVRPSSLPGLDSCCSSRAQVLRPIPARQMVLRCCALRCANFCAAKPCIISAYRPPAR